MKSQAFHFWDKSMSYLDFRTSFETIAHSVIDNPTEKEAEYQGYYELNWRRSTRVEKTYQISEEALQTVQNLPDKQSWIVITEGWCGDSSQLLPVIASLAEHSNGNIELRINSRDTYPELLEMYKTNGAMGIPKMIAMDKNGNELWTWGPRPQYATDLFVELKGQGLEKTKIYESMHVWYAKDKGKTVEAEIVSLLK